MSGALATVSFALLIMFGPRAMEAAGTLGGGGYALARLWGHTVSPLPEFPWWDGWSQFFAQRGVLLELAAIWGPGMLVAAVAVRLPLWRTTAPHRSAWLGGVATFSLLAQVPVLARPLWQIAAATPPAILLGVAAADLLLAMTPAARWVARLALAGAAAYGLAIVLPMAAALTSKEACLGAAVTRSPLPALARLGTVQVTGERARTLAKLVDAIRTRVPAGGRVYLAAPRDAYAVFLSDRAPLPPFALTYLAATRGDRLAIVAALEHRPPPLLLITEGGLDLPFTVEHPEEWAWIRDRYRLDVSIGEVQLWVPRK